MHKYKGKSFVVTNADSVKYRIVEACLKVSLQYFVCLNVWVCNEQRIQVQRQKASPECSRGILAQTGHQMSEQCENLLSRPVTLFLEL